MIPAVVVASSAALAYVVLVARGTRGPARAVKVVPALALATIMPSPSLAAAFAFCAVGDAFLLDKERFLLPGLGAFLVGHLCFTAGFLGATGETPGQAMIVLVALAAGTVLATLAPGLRGALRFAVPVYALVLGAMVASASTAGPLGVAGGLVFMLSDTILGFHVFRRALHRGDLAVMITYYAAIGLLAAAVLT